MTRKKEKTNSQKEKIILKKKPGTRKKQMAFLPVGLPIKKPLKQKSMKKVADYASSSTILSWTGIGNVNKVIESIGSSANSCQPSIRSIDTTHDLRLNTKANKKISMKKTGSTSPSSGIDTFSIRSKTTVSNSDSVNSLVPKGKSLFCKKKK